MKRRLFGFIVLAVGAMMLVNTLGWFDFDWFFQLEWKQYIVPCAVMIVGIKLLLSSCGSSHINKEGMKECAIPEMGGNDRMKISTAFAGHSYNFMGRKFAGSKIDCFMGGVRLNLDGAIIEQDCVIDVQTFMGGVDIMVPKNVNVMVNSNCFVGGVDNKLPVCNDSDAKTITVNASCFMGGVKIKE